MHVKILALRLYLRLYDADNSFHYFLQGDLLRRQRHLSALDLGHIQYVIDQPEQMLSGQGDLSETVLNLFLVIDMRYRDRRHAYDGIHRRPDIMAHIGQEGAFCLRRHQRLPPCLIQIPHLLTRHFIIYIENG